MDIKDSLPKVIRGNWMFLAVGIAAFCSLLSVSSCAPKVEPYQTMVNRGIIPLSGTNAYVGSNLFLAREAELSSVLFNFLKSRGGPLALELVSNPREPLKMALYYPNEREYYSAALEERERDKYREWIVRGPYRLDRRLIREFEGLREATNREPVFVIQGRLMRFRQEEAASPRVISPRIVIPTPTPTPRPRPRPVVRPTEPPNPASTNVAATTPRAAASDDPLEGKVINRNILAIIASEGFAPRNLAGDLVHTATQEEEPLERIARWYTMDGANAAVLAAALGQPVEKPMVRGQTVTIPRSLLKRFRPMPRDFT